MLDGVHKINLSLLNMMAPTRDSSLNMIKDKIRKLEINQDSINFLEPKFQYLCLALSIHTKGIAAMPSDQFLPYLGVGASKEVMFKIYDEYVDVAKALTLVGKAAKKMQER